MESIEQFNYIAATADPLILNLSYEQLLSLSSEVGIAVSLVLPKGKRLDQMVKMIEIEIENISKSVATTQEATEKRANGLTAWNLGLKLIQAQKRESKNGLACFVIVKPVSTMFYTDANIIATLIEPSQPLCRLFVSCAAHLEAWPLREGMDPSGRVGILTMEKDSAVFAVIEKGKFRVLNSVSSNLPKKHGRGGASAVRFARLRQEKRAMFYKLVAACIFTHYFDDEVPNVSSLSIFGDPNNHLETVYKQDKSAGERLHLLPISYETVPEGTELTRGATAAIVFERLQLKNHLLEEIQEHPKVALMFGKPPQSQVKAGLGADATNFYLSRGVVSEIILTKTSYVQFGVRENEITMIGFAEPTLLQSLALNVPERYAQKFAGQASLDNYFKSLLESMDDPPTLIQVDDKTPLSKLLSKNHMGVGCLLKPNCQAMLPEVSQTQVALEALGCISSSELV